LFDDGAAAAQTVTRDYVLELDREGPPLLSIFGGKITTGRALAEEAVAKVGVALGMDTAPRTRARIFPGGGIADIDALCGQVARRWPFLGAERAQRMTHAYGTAVAEMLREVASPADLGREFGAGLSEVEARWLWEREWARTPEDVLSRRSKLGLHLSDAEQAAFAAWWATAPLTNHWET